jgi:hypothetical protein
MKRKNIKYPNTLEGFKQYCNDKMKHYAIKPIFFYRYEGQTVYYDYYLALGINPKTKFKSKLPDDNPLKWHGQVHPYLRIYDTKKQTFSLYEGIPEGIYIAYFRDIIYQFALLNNCFIDEEDLFSLNKYKDKIK